MASHEKPPYEWRLKAGAMGNWYDIFCKVKEPKLTEGTCLLYEHTWDWFAPAMEQFDERWFAFKSGKKPMTSEERRIAETQWLTAVRMQILSRFRERSFSANTVNMRVRVMKTFWNYLRDVERVVVTKFTKDEWALVFRKPPAGEQRIPYTPDEVDLWTKFKPSSYQQWRTWTIGMFMLDCGARIEECQVLRKDDMHVRDEMVQLTGKGDKKRWVKVSKFIVPHLLRWMTRFVDSDLENPYVFGVKRGKGKITKRNAHRNLMTVLRKSGIMRKGVPWPKGKAWHSFRHTSATAKLVNEEDIYRLKETLGHADIKTTEKYLHLAHAYTKGMKDSVSPLNPSGNFATRR